MYLPKNIGYLRRKAGLTQKELSEKIGVVSNQIGKYEREESLIPVDKLIVLVEFFGVSYDEIMSVDMSQREHAREVKESDDSGLSKVIIRQEEQLQRYEQMIREESPELARRLGLL